MNGVRPPAGYWSLTLALRRLLGCIDIG